MKPLFKDIALQKKFEKDGFIKLPFFSADKAKELREFYMSTEAEHKATGAGFHTTSHTSNPELIESVNSRLRDEMIKAVDQYLINYKAMHSNFLVKEPGVKSETPWHQDWSFVDETKYFSFSAWIALEDIDETNGCMQFIEASHRIMPTLRISPIAPWWYSKAMEIMDEFKIDAPAKAGEGFIFYHSSIHASPDNKSDKPRVACVLGMYPDEAELLHFYLEPGKPWTEIAQYKMTINDYYSIGHNQPPKTGKFEKYVSFDFTQMEEPEFRRLMRNALGWRRQTYFNVRKLLKKISA